MKKIMIWLSSFITIFVTLFSIIFINNYTFVYVQSESMTASEIYKGSTYLIKKQSNYEIGDIIAFNHGDNTIWFHEIVAIKDESFITKGSSNPLPDSGSVTKDQIIGSLVNKNNYNFIANTTVRIIFILIIYLINSSILIYSFIVTIKVLRDPKDPKEKKMNNNKTSCILILLLILPLGFMTVSANSQHSIICNNVISYIGVKSNFTTNTSGSIIDYDNNSGEINVVIPATDTNGNKITSVDNLVIINNPTIETLTISANINQLGWLNFFNCPNLKVIILEAENPITQWTSYFGLQLDKDIIIYVPDSVINKYKKASGWSSYKNQIKSISEIKN